MKASVDRALCGHGREVQTCCPRAAGHVWGCRARIGLVWGCGVRMGLQGTYGVRMGLRGAGGPGVTLRRGDCPRARAPAWHRQPRGLRPRGVSHTLH